MCQKASWFIFFSLAINSNRCFRYFPPPIVKISGFMEVEKSSKADMCCNKLVEMHLAHGLIIRSVKGYRKLVWMVFINVTDTPGSRPGRVVQLIPPLSHLLAGGGSDSSYQVNLNNSLFGVIKHTHKKSTGTLTMRNQNRAEFIRFFFFFKWKKNSVCENKNVVFINKVHLNPTGPLW